MLTEETAPPGYWKSEILVALGVWLMISPFVVPPAFVVYNIWFVGLVAANVALMMAGNRKWERPVAAAAAIWLYISGFAPSLLQGRALMINEMAIGAVLILTSISAFFHLRDDVRHARPFTL